MAKAKAKAVRETARMREMRREQERKWEYDRGFKDGAASTEKRVREDVRIRERQANIDLAKALSSMTESTARAIVTFIGEGGLRG